MAIEKEKSPPHIVDKPTKSADETAPVSMRSPGRRSEALGSIESESIISSSGKSPERKKKRKLSKGPDNDKG